jgi:hypothetical protein
MACQDMIIGGGGGANPDMNPEQVSYRHAANTTRRVPGVMANLERVSYHPVANTRRKVPAP